MDKNRLPYQVGVSLAGLTLLLSGCANHTGHDNPQLTPDTAPPIGTHQDMTTQAVTVGLTTDQPTSDKIVCGAYWFGGGQAYQPLCAEPSIINRVADDRPFKKAGSIVVTICYRDDNITKIMEIPDSTDTIKRGDEFYAMNDKRVDVRNEPDASAGDTPCRVVLAGSSEAIRMVSEHDFNYELPNFYG